MAAVSNGQLMQTAPQQETLPLLDTLTNRLSPYMTRMQHHSQHLLQHEQRRKQAVLKEEQRLSGSLAPLSKLKYMANGFSLDVHPNLLPNSYYRLEKIPNAPKPPQGIYLYGDVGCGKTLLMDMLFVCSTHIVPSQRIHYHPFMTYVYQTIHQYDLLSPSERAKTGIRHPLDYVVHQMGRANTSAGGASVLCFDEFQISDVADARLMHGVFTRLMKSGTVVCFTANRAPSDLNRSQLLDDDFKPFLNLLYDRCQMVHMDGLDFREVLEQADGAEWYFNVNEEHRVREIWNQLTGDQWDDVVHSIVPVAYGREFRIPRASPSKRAAQVSTEQLIDAPVGANDYRALAKFADTIFITDPVPIFTSDTRNLARRFITLIDVCYEEKTRIVMRTEAQELDGMFSQVDPARGLAEIAEGLQFETEVGKTGVGAQNRQVGSGNLYSGEDERFAFRRAVSRLKEMRTAGFADRRPVLW